MFFILLSVLFTLAIFLFPVHINKYVPQLKTKIIIIAGLILVGLLSKSLTFARESKVYYVLNKWTGDRSVISTPKPFLVMPFASEVREWDKFIEVKGIPFVKEEVEINKKLVKKNTSELNITDEALREVEGVIKGGISVRFIDKVTADVYPSVRFMLPTDEQQFIKIVEKYRTQENLTMNTLVPTVSEQLKNVTFMFTADEYVSGGAVNFRAEIEDVLRNGSFVYSSKQVKDTIYSEPTLAGDSIKTGNNKREIREIKILEKNVKLTQNGKALRKPHEITDLNIFVDQVIIDDIELEDDYETKLKLQRDLAATAIVEGQKIKTAKVAQLRIVAEGERDKSQERVNKEKEQITKLISIETKVKEEKSNRDLAEINVQTEELRAKATKISADAEAYKNAKLVQAGLTPLERATIEKETKIGIAKELKSMNVPSNLIMGGTSGNSTESMLQVKLMKDLLAK